MHSPTPFLYDLCVRKILLFFVFFFFLSPPTINAQDTQVCAKKDRFCLKTEDCKDTSEACSNYECLQASPLVPIKQCIRVAVHTPAPTPNVVGEGSDYIDISWSVIDAAGYYNVNFVDETEAKKTNSKIQEKIVYEDVSEKQRKIAPHTRISGLKPGTKYFIWLNWCEDFGACSPPSVTYAQGTTSTQKNACLGNGAVCAVSHNDLCCAGSVCANDPSYSIDQTIGKCKVKTVSSSETLGKPATPTKNRTIGNTVEITWELSKNAKGDHIAEYYKIFYRKSGEADFTELSTLVPPVGIDRFLQNSTYSIHINACNSTGCSPPSDELIVTTGTDPDRKECCSVGFKFDSKQNKCVSAANPSTTKDSACPGGWTCEENTNTCLNFQEQGCKTLKPEEFSACDPKAQLSYSIRCGPEKKGFSCDNPKRQQLCLNGSVSEANVICQSDPPPPPPCLEGIDADGDPFTEANPPPQFEAIQKCTKAATAFGGISTNPAEFITRIFGIILGFSGGIALLLIIFSGYQMMMSQGNPEKIQGARETLTSAIVGLLFIIFSLVILEFIGLDILRIPGFQR